MTNQTKTQGGTELIDGLARIAEGYDALLCDLWGCFHNGVAPYPAAVAALRAFRAKGGIVVLVTNAPRPREMVKRHLDSIGAPEDSYDAIVSSGDATRAALADGRYGRRMHMVSAVRDARIWDGLDLEPTPQESAEAILCAGLHDDETETPADYAEMIAEGVRRGLPMLCANPDVIVDRGEQRIYCAGAIAQAYAQAGGEVIYFGKPHGPVYTLAIATAQRLKSGLANERILGVGDGIATDVLGAEQAGLDCLFVSGGLAADEVGETPERPDPEKLRRYLAAHGRAPRYTIGRLS